MTAGIQIWKYNKLLYSAGHIQLGVWDTDGSSDDFTLKTVYFKANFFFYGKFQPTKAIFRLLLLL